MAVLARCRVGGEGLRDSLLLAASLCRRGRRGSSSLFIILLFGFKRSSLLPTGVESGSCLILTCINRKCILSIVATNEVVVLQFGSF